MFVNVLTFLQQILQVYNVRKDSDIWLAVPSTLHEIIDPLSSSRYTLETEQYQTGTPHPIFGYLFIVYYYYYHHYY